MKKVTPIEPNTQNETTKLTPWVNQSALPPALELPILSGSDQMVGQEEQYFWASTNHRIMEGSNGIDWHGRLYSALDSVTSSKVTEQVKENANIRNLLSIMMDVILEMNLNSVQNSSSISTYVDEFIESVTYVPRLSDGLYFDYVRS